MNEPFYTVGHSTRSIEGFVALLRSARVTFVADVRTVPRSRTNPQFNSDALPESLTSFQIGYEHIAALGGLRGRSQNVPPSVNAFWRNDSFHNYADYAMGDNFRDGFARLCELGGNQRCAIMCAEVLWWRCHRRIIADYLLAAGEQVFHLIGLENMQLAHMTEAARSAAAGALTYPAAH